MTFPLRSWSSSGHLFHSIDHFYMKYSFYHPIGSRDLSSVRTMRQWHGLLTRRSQQTIYYKECSAWTCNLIAGRDLPTAVGTQDGGYLRKVPLPRIPLRQSTALTSCADPLDNPGTCYLKVPRIPTWSDLTRSHLGALRSSILPIAPRWLM
jgi:hypothetical protein